MHLRINRCRTGDEAVDGVGQGIGDQLDALVEQQVPVHLEHQQLLGRGQGPVEHLPDMAEAEQRIPPAAVTSTGQPMLPSRMPDRSAVHSPARNASG